MSRTIFDMTMPRVISADNHIIDPKDLYVERLPAALRDRAPRVLRADDGGDGWSWFGRPPSRTFGLEAVAGQTGEQFRPTGMRWDEILPGNYDGAAHLADMDRDGIDGAVVYPQVAMAAYSIPDRELAVAVMRTYNDWLLEDFTAVDRRRLVGLCALPVDDGIDVAAAELERCAAKGARGFFLPGIPERPYHDRMYDPLWRAACEADVALSFHRTHGGRPKDGAENVLSDEPGLNVGGIAVRFFSAVEPFTNMIFTGVFARFPKLRIVAGEVNCGWMPFWIENMDQNFRQQKHWAQIPIDEMPSEAVGRNVFVTTLDDHVGFAAIPSTPKMADAVMYSTDYPHSVSLWPNSPTIIPELTATLDTASTKKVLSGNAARVYHM